MLKIKQVKLFSRIAPAYLNYGSFKTGVFRGKMKLLAASLISVIFFAGFVRSTIIATKGLCTFIGEEAANNAVSSLLANPTNKSVHTNVKDQVRKELAKDKENNLFQQHRINFEDWSNCLFHFLYIFHLFRFEQIDPKLEPYISELNCVLSLRDQLASVEGAFELKTVLKTLYFHAILDHELLSPYQKEFLDHVLYGFIETYQQKVCIGISVKTNFEYYDLGPLPNTSYSFLKLGYEDSQPTISGKDMTEAEPSEPYFFLSLTKLYNSDSKLRKQPLNLKAMHAYHTEKLRLVYNDLAATLINWDKRSLPENFPSRHPFKDLLTNFIYSAFISKVPTLPISLYNSASLEELSEIILNLFIRHVMMFDKQLQVHKKRLSFPFDSRLNNKVLKMLELGLETLKGIKNLLLQAEHVQKEKLELFDSFFKAISDDLSCLKGKTIPIVKVTPRLAKYSKIQLSGSIDLASTVGFGFQKNFELQVAYLLEYFFNFPTAKFEEWAARYSPIERELSAIFKKEVFGEKLSSAIICHFNSIALYLFIHKRLFDFSDYGDNNSAVRRCVIANLPKPPGPADASYTRIREFLRDELIALDLDPIVANSVVNMACFLKSMDFGIHKA